LPHDGRETAQQGLDPAQRADEIGGLGRFRDAALRVGEEFAGLVPRG